MLKLFYRYFSVGLVNTAIHWGVFGLCIYALKTNQATANLFGFVIAVTFSFFANARYTFKKKATSKGYLLFIGFMGLLAAGMGFLADAAHIPGIITLILFSGTSLVLGFLYSKFIVFN